MILGIDLPRSPAIIKWQAFIKGRQKENMFFSNLQTKLLLNDEKTTLLVKADVWSFPYFWVGLTAGLVDLLFLGFHWSLVGPLFLIAISFFQHPMFFYYVTMLSMRKNVDFKPDKVKRLTNTEIIERLWNGSG